MSPSNAETLRRAYEAWDRAGWEGVAGAFSTDIEVHPPGLWPESEPVRGRENFRRTLEAALEMAAERPTLEVLELLEVGDRVLATVNSRGRSRSSRIYMEASYCQVFAFQGDTVCRIDFYLDLAEARDALGLPRTE